MGNVPRLPGRLLPYTNTGPIQEYLHFYIKRQSYKFKALLFDHSHRKGSPPKSAPHEWHLKNNCRVSDSLEKVIPRSLYPHLKWWLQEENVLQGQLLHPFSHALQIFYRCTRRVKFSLARTLCKGNLVPSRNQAVVTKGGVLALNYWQDLCSTKLVLVATDNTTVVLYINKKGGMRSGSPWRILNRCSRNRLLSKPATFQAG